MRRKNAVFWTKPDLYHIIQYLPVISGGNSTCQKPWRISGTPISSGMFAAVTMANFGGTIAGLREHHGNGHAMSVFLWAATG